jgi:hypothetical protein
MKSKTLSVVVDLDNWSTFDSIARLATHTNCPSLHTNARVSRLRAVLACTITTSFHSTPRKATFSTCLVRGPSHAREVFYCSLVHSYCSLVHSYCILNCKPVAYYIVKILFKCMRVIFIFLYCHRLIFLADFDGPHHGTYIWQVFRRILTSICWLSGCNGVSQTYTELEWYFSKVKSWSGVSQIRGNCSGVYPIN